MGWPRSEAHAPLRPDSAAGFGTPERRHDTRGDESHERRDEIDAIVDVAEFIRNIDHEMESDRAQRAAARVVEDPGENHGRRHGSRHEQPEPKRAEAFGVMPHAFDEEERQMPERPDR